MSETRDPDRVEKTIDLRAPRARVWRALTSATEVAAWFGLGEPLELVGTFEPGAEVDGIWQVDGKPQRSWFCTVEHVEPERLPAFRWVPYEVPAGEDPKTHPTTRIEMRLDEIASGTRLTISESGFAALPADKQYKRDQNGDGWATQAQSIAAHLFGRVDVRVTDRVRRPVGEVLEAIVDPARLASYFVTHGSARLAPWTQVEWHFGDAGPAGTTLTVDVIVVEARKVVFGWKATGQTTKVVIALAPAGEATELVITEAPFPLTDDGARRAMQQTQGWTDFACCLRAYLHHAVNLRTGQPVDVA